jgi:putative tryptophan/tyrosine transport system substrate-binding protein
MKRRTFIAGLGSAVVWPLAAFAQRGQRQRRLGMLLDLRPATLDVFRWEIVAKRLEELGWIEGRNLIIDRRFAGGDLEQARAYARELVALNPDVIFAISNVVPAAQAATATIPIVFVGGADPVTENLGVSSLPRPGSNITGFTNNPPSIGTKRLQVLKDIAPRVAHVALMYDPVLASGPLEFLAELQTLPRSIGVDIEQTPVRNSSEIEQSFSALADKPNTGLIVYAGGATVENRDTIILEAAKHKIPAVYRDRGYVAAGGLASYGADGRESTLGAANYIGRILQGAKPNELPVQRPTKFQLVLNLKVAKALGLEISQNLLAIADELIE